MTIDEMIYTFKEAEVCKFSKAELVDMLEELKWYREQDLIRRDDIQIGEILAAFGGFEDIRPVIMRIPKAEPPEVQ